MTRPTSKPRYIKAETICIGDVIRVTHKWKDVEISVVGKVARRERNTFSTEYITDEGHVILEWFTPFRGMKYTITLLDRPIDRQEMLPGMEI